MGYILFMHGWAKVTGAGLAGVSGYMAKSWPRPRHRSLASAAIFLETVGALCLLVGLFTRFFAAALAVEIGMRSWWFTMSNGFSASKGGFEYVLLWGSYCSPSRIRGGGPYSVDAKIGKEL